MANVPGNFSGDDVPSLDSLLHNGVPGLSALDTFIADLDVQLEENSKTLDKCLNSVMKQTSDIVGKVYVTPRDALLSMLSNHVLEKASCYDPEPDAITDILSHASHMLEQCPGSEEAVLQDLLSLSSEQGVSLPLKSAAVDPIASTLSVNAVSDSSEIQIAQQWDRVALHLSRYFYDKLSSLPVAMTKPVIDVNEGKRLKYLQSLITLQPVDEVWDRYQALRSKQLEHCFTVLMPESEPENLDFLKITENCREVAQIINQMMDEDFVLLNSGVLKRSVNIFRAFHKNYLEKFSDEMSALVEEIWDEVREGFQRGPSQSFSGQGSKRKSEPKLKSLLRGQAQSLESVVSQLDNAASTVPSMSIPAHYVTAMLNIVRTIVEIEEHVGNLHRASAWDFAGLAAKRNRRKGSLRGVLKPSSSPDLSGRPLSADSDSWMFSESFTSSFGSDSSVMFETPAGPRVTVVEKMRAEEKLRWDWKLMFKKIAPDLGACVEQRIRGVSSELLGQEQQLWETCHVLEKMPVPTELWGGRLDYPKYISKAVSGMMEELDLFLPFAVAGADGTLSTVRTTFVDAANLCLKNFHVHLLKLSSDVPVTSGMKHLYVILSSAAFIRNYLLHYETVLSADDSKKMFSLLYKQFVELVESLSQLLLQLHNNYLATSILHDTESNNWTELKEFYEGERCSFPVQMWNFYLRGVQQDLWSVCPPKLSQSTLSQLLESSLAILTRRYLQAKPSFRRTGQFRCDVMTILLSVSELLYPSSNTISRCIDVSHTQSPHHAIHNLCSTLLSAMAVVVSPLDILYRINKKGFQYRKRRHSQQASAADSSFQAVNTQWLSWIQPTLYQSKQKSLDDMRTTTALYLQVKLLLCQPELNFPMVLQAYLMKDYTLSILFLTQALSLTVSPTQSTKPVAGNQLDPMKQQLSDVRQFAMSLMRVLIRCSRFPDCLVKLLLPVIDRCLDWGCLDSRHVPGRDMPIPLWMDCLFSFMQPFVVRILKPVVEVVLAQPQDGKQMQRLSAVMEELPCGCRSQVPVTPRTRKSDESRDLVETVLRLVITQLADGVFVLPTPLCVLFHALQDQCHERGTKTPHHCVGLKMVALALKQYLGNTSLLEELSGLTFSQTERESFTLLSDCVYHVIVSGKVKGSSTPRLAGRFCKDNKDWMNDRLQIVVNYLNSEIFEDTDSLALEGATAEYADQFYLTVASDVLGMPSGRSDLERLYWMVSNNQLWLEKHLDIQQLLPLDRSRDGLQFIVNMAARPMPDFDPMKEFKLIGPCKLDHAAIDSVPLNWEKLLQSELGLSELGFRSLLYNRHEMQDGAYLEDNERKPVATLRAVFENEPRELG